MARKRKGDTPESDSLISPAAQASEGPQTHEPEPQVTLTGMVPRDDGAGASAAREIKPRVSMTLREDGVLDLGSLRADTREKLKAALPAEVLAELGCLPRQAVAPVTCDPAILKPLWPMLGVIEARIFARVYKCPVELAERVFTYSEIECGMLSVPAAKVLSKYGGDFLSKYNDELALVLAFVAVTQQKVFAMQAAAAQYRAKETQAAQAVKAAQEAAQAAVDPLAEARAEMPEAA